MSFLGEIICEMIFDIILSVFPYPGVMINWAIRKEPLTFSMVVKRYRITNFFISLLIYAIVVLALW